MGELGGYCESPMIGNYESPATGNCLVVSADLLAARVTCRCPPALET